MRAILDQSNFNIKELINCGTTSSLTWSNLTTKIFLNYVECYCFRKHKKQTFKPPPLPVPLAGQFELVVIICKTSS